MLSPVRIPSPDFAEIERQRRSQLFAGLTLPSKAAAQEPQPASQQSWANSSWANSSLATSPAFYRVPSNLPPPDRASAEVGASPAPPSVAAKLAAGDIKPVTVGVGWQPQSTGKNSSPAKPASASKQDAAQSVTSSPTTEPTSDDFESVFNQLGKDFQTRFGRPWEVTGGAETQAHQRFRKGKARDVRSKTLKREEIDFVISRGAQLGLRVKDFSSLKGPHRSASGVLFTGPHLHIERDEEMAGFQGDVDSILQKYGVGSSKKVTSVEQPLAPAGDQDALAQSQAEIDSILGKYGVGQSSANSPAQSQPGGESQPAIWNKEDPGYATEWNIQRMIDEGVRETAHLPGSTRLVSSSFDQSSSTPSSSGVSPSNPPAGAPSPYRLTVAGLGDDASQYTPEILKSRALQSLGFPESAAKKEPFEFRIPHDEIVKRIQNGTLDIDIPADEADYLKGRAAEAKRVEEFLQTASMGDNLTDEQIAEIALKPGIKPPVESVSTVTGRPAQKPLPREIEREVTAKTTIGDLPELATRPLQYLSTLTSGAQRAVGAEVSDMLGLSKNARAGYGPLDILDAAAHRFYTGEIRPGYEQPVAELYKLAVERFGGDPDSAFNKLMRDTLELGTDPVSLATMGAGAKAAPARSSAPSSAAKIAGQSSALSSPGIISKAKTKVSEFLKREPEERRASVLEVISTFRKAGLITGVKTQARNIGGNTAFQVAEEISRMPAALVDLAMSAITKRRTVQGLSPSAVWKSTRAAATEGVAEARNIIRTGATPSQLAAYSMPDEIVTGSKILDTFINGSFRLQAAEDAVFKRFAASRSLREQATLMARDEAKRGLIKRRNIAGRVDEILEGTGIDPGDYALMQARAVEDAAFATFQNTNKAMDFAEGLIQRSPQGVKFAVDIIAPYRRTPTNIIARILDYTPIGAGKGTLRLARSIAKGAFTESEQAAFAKAMGRATTGTAVIMLGYKLREKGLMTGFIESGFDQESKRGAWNERRLMEAGGKLPGAVRIGDTWVEVGRYSPLGNLLALGAAMYDREEKGESLPAAAGREAFNVATSQPLVESAITDLPEIITDPKRYAKNLAGSFVPTITSDVAGQMDDKERGTGEEFYGAAQKRIPGARESLPSRLDIFGRDIEPSASLNPFAMREAKDFPPIKEIRRLGVEVFAPERFPADTDAQYEARARRVGEARQHNLKAVTESGRYSKPPQGIDADTFKRAALREAIYAESKVRQGEEDLIFHNARVRVERESLLDQARRSSEYAALTEGQRKEFDRAVNFAFYPAKAERSAKDGGINLLLRRREDTLSGLLRKKKSILDEAMERAKSSKKTAGVTHTTPAPEKPSALRAQIASLESGNRLAVLVTPGERKPSIPRGMKTVQTKAGTFIYDPKQIKGSEILDRYHAGEHGELLGHVAPKPKDGAPSAIIAARDPRTGEEIQSSVVPPEMASAQTEAFREQYPDAVIEAGGEDLAERIISERESRFGSNTLAQSQASVDQAAHAAATSPANDLAEPTEAQLRAGNYLKGHTRISGLEISIENPKGTYRREAAIRPNKHLLT